MSLNPFNRCLRSKDLSDDGDGGGGGGGGGGDDDPQQRNKDAKEEEEEEREEEEAFVDYLAEKLTQFDVYRHQPL